jgi:hypothetical protein
MNLETLNPKPHTHMFLCDVPTIQGPFLKQFFKNCGWNVNDDQSIQNMVFWMNFIHEQAMLNEFWIVLWMKNGTFVNELHLGMTS